ncbi:MAG: hypothetical protein PHG08_00830 [Bacilli bacterium]|nr:hypothetical protein [Bacilli bacterium]
MNWCLYLNEEWVAIWSEKPTVNELNQLVKDRDLSVKLLNRRKIKDSGNEYKLIQRKLIGQ